MAPRLVLSAVRSFESLRKNGVEGTNDKSKGSPPILKKRDEHPSITSEHQSELIEGSWRKR